LVGHCGADSTYLRIAVAKADKEFQVISADDAEELEGLLKEGIDLILFNRLVDYGFPESLGADIIKRYASDYPRTKMMVVSNYPDAHAAAVKAGGLPGFGKRELGTPKVSEVLHQALKV
jgi:two-component system, chemotaxis family, chemotaxis protein CheY